MAVGDKLPVVMGREKAVANGVATLGADGILAEGQRPTTDATPAQGSANPVQSGGVYTALAGKADTTLSNLSNYQKALHNIGGRPNRNLLDNWYFVGGGSQEGGGQFPINQRGQVSYATTGHTIDRWLLSHDTTAAVTVTEEGVALSNSGEGNLFLIQKSERVYDDRSEYTFSVLTAENMLYSAVLKPRSSTYPASGLYFSLSADSVTIGALAGNAWNIKAVKLESGSTQTLAYQDEDGNWQLFETPDYAEELAKCQRYLQVFGQYDAFVCINTGTSYMDFMIPLSTPFRTQPVVLANGGLNGLIVAWYNRGNLIRMRVSNRTGTVGEVLALSSNCILSAEL